MVLSSTLLRFDYKKMYISTGGRADYMIEYFKSLKESSGLSFIVNPSVVIENPHKCSTLQLSEYLGMCALRNYGEYLITGIVDLKLALIPNWVPIQVYECHPLLKYNSKLRLLEFLYER